MRVLKPHASKNGIADDQRSLFGLRPPTWRMITSDLSAHLRPDGNSETWEWTDPATDTYASPLCAATVALPYVSLEQVGLVRRLA